MTEFDEERARRMYRELKGYYAKTRTERDPNKNLKVTEKALETMDIMERTFPREFINRLIREDPL